MHITGIINIVADDMTRLDVDLTCKVSKDILKGMDKKDYIQCKHVSLNILLIQLLQGNTD